MLESINQFSPKTAKFCELSFKNSSILSKYDEIKLDEVEFKKISSNSIDYEIVQKLKHIKMIPLDLVWNDLGNWDVLSQTKDVCQTTKKVFQLSSNNNFIRGSDRIIATVGLENFIVIDTDDATLICKKGYAHRLKEIVEKINVKRYPQTKVTKLNLDLGDTLEF